MDSKKIPTKKKQEIVEISKNLINEKGVNNVSIRDIVKSVGMAQGLFYYYFKSKEEILNKVQEIVSEQLDVDAADIVLTADIKEDLEADSLDVFEIMNELEDELDIQLEADESIKTIQDVVDHVAKQLEAND